MKWENCILLTDPKKHIFEKFQNKYRIASARLKTWGYGWNGHILWLFASKTGHVFGDIIDGKMQLSETGEIAHKFWIEIPNHFSFVKLGEFVVIANHVHGVVIIDNNLETPNLGNDKEKTNLGVSVKRKKWTMEIRNPEGYHQSI